MGAQILSSNISICFWRKDIPRQVSLPTSITPDPALGLDLGKWLLVLCCSLLLPDHAPPSFLAPPILNLIYQNMLPDPPTLLLSSTKAWTDPWLHEDFNPAQHYSSALPNTTTALTLHSLGRWLFTSLISVLHNLCSTQILCLPYMVKPLILGVSNYSNTCIFSMSKNSGLQQPSSKIPPSATPCQRSFDLPGPQIFLSSHIFTAPQQSCALAFVIHCEFCGLPLNQGIAYTLQCPLVLFPQKRNNHNINWRTRLPAWASSASAKLNEAGHKHWNILNSWFLISSSW